MLGHMFNTWNLSRSASLGTKKTAPNPTPADAARLSQTLPSEDHVVKGAGREGAGTAG